MGGHISAYVSATRPDVYLAVDSTWYGPFSQDDYSPLLLPNGQPLFANDPSRLQYRVDFKWASPVPPSAAIIATPYVDDITLYYDPGDVGYWVYHPL
jgi:hypothetical protein